MAKMHFAKEAAPAQNFFFVCTTEDITLGVIALSSISTSTEALAPLVKALKNEPF